MNTVLKNPLDESNARDATFSAQDRWHLADCTSALRRVGFAGVATVLAGAGIESWPLLDAESLTKAYSFLQPTPAPVSIVSGVALPSAERLPLDSERKLEQYLIVSIDLGRSASGSWVGTIGDRVEKRREQLTVQLQGSLATSTPIRDWDDWVDWDVGIEIPPARPTQTIRVRFVDGGYRKPRIVDEPQD